MIKDLISKKDKFGRPDFSDYLEKIKALEDLKNNQPLNPKTNKIFTPKEWLETSPTSRSKSRDPEAFREKKKEYQKEYMRERKLEDPEFAEKQKTIRKEEYYTRQRKRQIGTGQKDFFLRERRNSLLSFLVRAAKDNPNYEKILEKDALVGVTDKLNNVNYYEAGYKGKLGKNSKLIINHPQYEDVNKLLKLATRFKTELPNKAIASYFSAYARVPTMSEMYNFLQADPRFIKKMSPQFFTTNSLHLHHQATVTKSPAQKIQLLLQDKNDRAGKQFREFKKGNITEEQLNKDLKKLNARYYVDGKPLGAIETSPEIQLRTARAQTTKLFNKKLKENPNLVKEMMERLKIQMISNMGCGVKARALGLGGRVNFANGSDCYNKGLKKIESGNLTPFERSIAGNYLKEAGAGTQLIKNIVKGGAAGLRLLQDFTIGTGPIGLGITAALTVPFVLKDLSEGKRGSEALSNATLGLLGRSEKSILKGIGGPEVEKGLEIEEKYKKLIALENEEENLENNIMSSFTPDDIYSGYRDEIAPLMIDKKRKDVDKEYESIFKFLTPFFNKDGSDIDPNAPGYKELLKAREIKAEEEKLKREYAKASAWASTSGIDDFVPIEDDGRTNPLLEEADLKKKQIKEQQDLYYENLEKYNRELSSEISPDDSFNMSSTTRAAKGGRIKLGKGTRPKMSRQ